MKRARYTAEDPVSEEDYWTREHTFKDSSLVDAASVQLKAEELVAKNASLITEVDVALPQIEPLEIYDLLTMSFEEVNLDAEVGIVKSIRYVYGAGGVRTDFKTHHRGYFLADTLAKLHNIVSQLDTGVHNVPGNGELPPPVLPPALSGIMTMRTDVGTFASPMFIESVDCDNSRLLQQPAVESSNVVLTPTAVETAVESLEVGITPKATETMSDTAATTKPGTTLTRETGVGSSSVAFAKNTIILQRVQANLTGTLTKLTVYGLGSADGSTRLKGVLYSDVSGAPSALLATGAEVTSPVSAGWIDLTGFSYAITSATYYWIGFMVGPNTAGTHNYTVYYYGYQNYHWTAYKAITYPTPPNPITTPSYYDYQLSIYGTATTNT